MNYLNKALDLFNTAIVSPVYYVMFTVLTICKSISHTIKVEFPVFVMILSHSYLLPFERSGLDHHV